MLHESGFAYKMGSKFISFDQFRGYLSSGSASDGIPVSLGTGAAVATEGAVAGAELSGLPMTTGDELYTRIKIPEEMWDCDFTKDLHAQVHAENKTAGAVTTVDFVLSFKGQSATEAASDAKSSPDATVTFPACGAAAVGLPYETVKQALGAVGTFAADKYLLIALTLADDGDAGADEVILTGITLFYSVQQLDPNRIGKST